MFFIYNDAGRITQMVGQSQPGYADLLREAGTNFVEVGQDMTDTYVDLSSGTPALKRRPELPGEFDTTTLKPFEQATLPGVPACSIVVEEGPLGPGQTPHPGGDLAIGFVVPGSYRLSIEPFPYRRRVFTLTVTEPSAQ
ncbi:hypothetical protein [Methylobacterium nodulans]|uniref:Uncharacterized protein n=1 Tax=Methylobacterium nodulans (strain LMG 21967 / CNCM I-2342 / ORS 2060) TaxID=460265 RepID=B8INR7_METNO|nr:hypothetical protein [Methylobacterium nodulans]ACL58433.1 conserved hypothetical protein [Methylobacterium nodulans ORS 2060]